MKATEKVLEAKSIHIFAWFFQFEIEEAEKLFKKVELEGWKRKNLKFNYSTSESYDYSNCFMLYQYLSKSARNIFIEQNVCHIYEYPNDKEYTYHIKKGENDIYDLPITSIELHLYQYGIGILFIQVSNNNFSNIADIKKINDYGRRISIPFLANKGELLCADEIGITWKEGNKLSSNITKFYSLIEQKTDKILDKAEFLYNLLNYNLNKEKENTISIDPVSDDRMFVCTVIRDANLSKEIINKTYDEEQLYSILFMDSKKATCQDKEMRKQLFKDAIYSRWADWGTLYAATSYSLCCITTDESIVNASVIKPFIVEYSYFISLVLAQRIGIISFANQAGKIVTRTKKKGNIKSKQAKELVNLQKQYINFKNQLLILEASTQEQGIEIYHLLQKQLLIKEEQAILNEQLQSLYEATNISFQNKLTIFGIAIAAVTILIDILFNIGITCMQKEGINYIDFIKEFFKAFIG